MLPVHILHGLTQEHTALQAQLASTTEALGAERTKRAEVEKEQEDLLVLLDELSSKRKRDKARMRDARIEVSEDEDEDDEDEDEDDQEEGEDT